MNMFKKNGGFTLVELIVVIAILAILAGVAVPAYSGYIAKANDAACLSELSALQTAAQSACAMNGKTLTGISIADNGTVTMTPAAGTGETNFDAFYTTTSANLSELLKKHSAYTAPVTWTVDNGWSILPND